MRKDEGKMGRKGKGATGKWKMGKEDWKLKDGNGVRAGESEEGGGEDGEEEGKENGEGRGESREGK